jgi:hypothetical protein
LVTIHTFFQFVVQQIANGWVAEFVPKVNQGILVVQQLCQPDVGNANVMLFGDFEQFVPR